MWNNITTHKLNLQNEFRDAKKTAEFMQEVQDLNHVKDSNGKIETATK